ncbi:MAG: serine/threonine-protein kinase, partial [Gemmatimonadaceae bacterium]
MTQADIAGYPDVTSRYVIRREIGRGGMATVYLADDVQHDREVAIKVLHSELSAAIGATRFSREIRTVARLQHPHILPLFDSGEANGTLFFVMPFVSGESLRDLIAREQALSLEATAAIVRQVGDALDYAHAQGVVHRDIKPENILLSQGQALLADFGVARVSANAAPDTLTAIGMALGTPAYMSPEQASGDPDVSKRSDLYALGCIVFELLSGNPPFVGANVMATMAQHITKPVPRVVGSRGELSDNVVAAVARMLDKEPSERFGSAAEFAMVLEHEVVVARQPSLGNRQLTEVVAAARAKQSVYVVDFTNITQAADVDWLSNGIAETVSVDLQKIGGVRVVSNDPASRQRVAKAKLDGPIGPEAARALG